MEIMIIYIGKKEREDYDPGKKGTLKQFGCWNGDPVRKKNHSLTISNGTKSCPFPMLFYLQLTNNKAPSID